MNLCADIDVACDGDDVPDPDSITDWLRAALCNRSVKRWDRRNDIEVSVRIVGPDEIQQLNAHYRHKDTATNVLSFPAHAFSGHSIGDSVSDSFDDSVEDSFDESVEDSFDDSVKGSIEDSLQRQGPGDIPFCHLGDIVICAAVVNSEARQQEKNPRAHWAHMVVHGVLHLLGYDHESDMEAEQMEKLEVEILHGLNFPSPYSVGDVAQSTL